MKAKETGTKAILINFRLRTINIMPKIAHKYEYEGKTAIVEFEVAEIKATMRPYVATTNMCKVKHNSNKPRKYQSSFLVHRQSCDNNG